MSLVKRIWYLWPRRAAKVQASLRIRRAVSPEPSLLAHTSNESRGTFRQKARSLAPLNGRACAIEIYHDGMLEDTNSLDGAQMLRQYASVATLSSYLEQFSLLYTPCCIPLVEWYHWTINNGCKKYCIGCNKCIKCTQCRYCLCLYFLQ